MSALTAALGALAGVALLALAQERRARREAEGAAEAAWYAAALQTAKLEGERRAMRLVHEWELITQGVVFADADEAAHALADWIAQRTGETIIATQADGDGLIVAVPDETRDA